ncbi:(2Fe-2S)-binding protein, partial [Streptomyces parvulus]|nr:(2Fe-2S)-binding protein [Streptomyces parvulus]
MWAAGETTGIGGAQLSLAEGHIAGLSIAARLRGTEPDPARWAPAARRRAGLRRSADALAAAFASPAGWTAQVTDDTLVCRCEEVTAGAVREAVGELGAGDVRTVKLLTRAGMGWCQGRMCGAAVAGLCGHEPGPARRPFAHPVPLGILARQEPVPHADAAPHAEQTSPRDAAPHAEETPRPDAAPHAEQASPRDAAPQTEEAPHADDASHSDDAPHADDASRPDDA